jgi:hypothetical protein
MILTLAILFTVVLVLGATIATQQNMIGYGLRVKADKKGLKIFEPIILCVWCMPSLWSLFGYGFSFLYCGIEFKMLLFYPVVVAANIILCGTIWGVIQIIIKKSNDENANIEGGGQGSEPQ